VTVQQAYYTKRDKVWFENYLHYNIMPGLQTHKSNTQH